MNYLHHSHIEVMLKLFFLSIGYLGLPSRNGKLKDVSKFDAQFFGVHPKQADTMDPQLRILLEVTYEAIVDSGRFYYIHF